MEKIEKLEQLVDLFTAPDVPEAGPGEEVEVDPPMWTISENETPEDFPGGGLKRHPMLYIGEGNNIIYLINDGKIIWKYATGKGWELDDVWMLSNGNIVFSRMSWAGEVTPKKELIWKYVCQPNEEIHTLQPIGDDKLLMIINGKPPRMEMIDRKTRTVLWKKEIPYVVNASVHGQFRRGRYTKDGTYLLTYLAEDRVVEYDENFNIIWSYRAPGAWAAVRLKNGNTLITVEREDRTIEVTPEGETVWELKLEELPEKYRLIGTQSCVRLENGNTILCSRGDGGKGPQLVEVTPEKEVVWCIKDWKNLGPATAIQLLDERGLSEIPGDCER